MLKRLPGNQMIFQVYAVTAVMLSGWTITAFLWKLSTWLLTLNLGEILVVFSYAMVANLVESLIVLLALLVISMVLPAHILRNDFAVRGAILSFGGIGSLILLLAAYGQGVVTDFPALLILPLLMLGLTVFLLSVSRWDRVRSTVLWISDRLMIFLYILVPLYIVFLLYVLVRVAV